VSGGILPLARAIYKAKRLVIAGKHRVDNKNALLD
jgi:hypothetical protein